MLPVSQAVQANKATVARTSGSGESSTDNGFAALFAQGLSGAGAHAPDNMPQADGGQAPQRSPGTPDGGIGKRPSGAPTRQDARADQAGTSPASADAPATPTTVNGDDKRTAGTDRSRATAAVDDAPDLTAAANLPFLQPGQNPLAPAPEPSTAGGAHRSHGLSGIHAGADDATGSADISAGVDSIPAAQDAWKDAAGKALAGLAGHGGAAAGSAAADAPAAGAGRALGAGLSALLARQGLISNGLGGGAGQDAALATLAGAGISKGDASADASQLYAQMVQSAAPAPQLDGSQIQLTSLPLAPPLGDQRWTAALGQQALFMARNQLSSAQLTVNPPHLGPIQITLDLNHDQATATFVSPHDAVRQAIEASLPQLRDMFSAAGLRLGDAQVQADAGRGFGQAAGGQGSPSGRGASGGGRTASAVTGADGVGASASSAPVMRHGRGLLDTFA
jgi:flagellar hook-length control protein FliK